MVLRVITRVANRVLIAGAFLGVFACSSTSVVNVEVGQCIDGNFTESEVSSLPIVDCAESHTGEIYSLPQLPDGDFPGDTALQLSAGELCMGPNFETYVGKPYLESTIYISYLMPSADTWSYGDREIVCILLSDESGSRGTGPLRGANR